MSSNKLRSHLKEVARSKARAKKLGTYLAKRSSPGWEDMIMSRSYDRYKAGGPPLSAYYGDHTRFRSFEEFPTVNVPVKDLISTQQYTNWNPDGDADWKLGDDRPIIVLKHEGKLYIWNGHHRYIAAKLKGDKTIPAKVWDPGQKSSRHHSMYGRGEWSFTRPPDYHEEGTVEEVYRDDERATKLGVYLAKRHKREGLVPSGGTIAFPTFDRAERHKIYTAADNLAALDNPSTVPPVMLNMDELRPTQLSTAFRRRFAERKLKDNEPIEVLHYHRNDRDPGTKHILNGHHRYMAHKLQGKKQISARVFHYYADREGGR
jgi:uncharacterized ParB-like nuclease family protein